jgi:hypothetical protein
VRDCLTPRLTMRHHPSGGRTTQNITPLFGPTCLGAHTCAPPSGATTLLILSLGTASFAVHLDFIMVADHAALRRATIHKVAASALAIVSVQLGVKLHMPAIVADPVISFLRPRRDTEKYGISPNIAALVMRLPLLMGQEDTHAEASCNDLTKWRLRLRIEWGSRRPMIGQVSCHRGVPPGRDVCNRTAWLTERRLRSLPRGCCRACVAAPPDLIFLLVTRER